MTGLIRSELLRARSRRIVWVLTVASIAGIVVGVTIAMANSRPPTDRQIERATAQHARDLEGCIAEGPYGDGELPPGSSSVEEYCEQNVRIEFYLPNDDIKLADTPEILEGASFMLALLAIVLGASLAGADWSTGTMTTVLAWEPRRVRVWLVRAIVVAAVLAIVLVVVQAVFTAAWFVGTTVSGTTETGRGFGGSVTNALWVGTVVAVAFGLVAHALASVGRSTIAGVGVIVGYAIIVEGFVAGFVEDLAPRLLIRAATVVISGNPMLSRGATVAYAPDGSLVGTEGAAVLLSVEGAWVVVGAYVVTLGLLAIALFQRRDVQ
ncbi:MAG TPA: ABC transporter permease subunit [Actinomycetota bacterium]|nr:ABC transporter permease subunit [Actinomycetota bacterium]